jgi:HTH-type transcriptional regulator/antitoxin HigA
MLLVEAYEREHDPIEAPDPIDLLQHVMVARGMTGSDLEPYIGARAKVGEMLNRVRPFMLEMIRRLASGLNLRADAQIRGYELKRAA